MLAISHHPSIYMSSAYNAFLPTIPSPLSPRSANVTTAPRRFLMSADQENASASASASDNDARKTSVVNAFSKRAVKKAPSPTQDELKEKRRRNFLGKVQDGRQEKRFEQRGEDMMRLDFYQRQRQWEAQQALSAPGLPFDTPEEDDEGGNELPVSSWAGSAMQISAPATQEMLPEDEVDDAMAREDEELAALLEFMPDDDGRSEHLWSDDEDYDALFSELVEKENAMSGQQEAVDVEQGEAMDVS